MGGQKPSGASRESYLALAGLWMVLLLFPLIAPNNFILNLGISWFISLLLAGSLNLLMGYAGQISLSHAAFYGLGAYASGVLSAKFGLSPWLGLCAAIALTAAAAFLIGWPSLKLRGHYLAMATLGFNVIMSVLFVELRDLTGGPNGLIGVPSLSLFGWEIGPDIRFYLFAWLVVGLMMLLLLNLLNSRMGRALRALSTSELAARANGIDVHAVKLGVFVLSAVMAGIAGFLYVHLNNFASPENFDFVASVMLLVVVALGGTGTYWGPFLGALLHVALPEALRAFSDYEILVYGISLVLVLLFFPGGLSGAAAWLVRLVGRGAPR
jgi:branched-chain amino acid transport system permease protein